MSTATGSAPRVSVITLTFNRLVALERCLESLANQTLSPHEFELVLVDVSDQPETRMVAAYRNRIDINHLPADNQGVAGNRNLGVQHARGSWLAFLDDDCVAAPDWLAALMRCASEHPDSLIGGGVKNLNPGNAVSCAGQVITEAVDACFNSGQGEPSFFPGLNFAVRKDHYCSLGGNDERFGRLAAEDRDFIDRWRRSGRGLVRAEHAIVIHAHRAQFTGFVRQYFNYGRGAWRYHWLARARGADTLDQVTRLHRGLWRYARKPLRELPLGMRVRVILLLVVWEVANALGFAWQATQDILARPLDRSRP